MVDNRNDARGSRGLGTARLFAAGAVLACVFALVPSAYAQKSRLNGTAVDANGAPVGGFTLLFEPAPGASEVAQKVKVGKKGTFSVPFFPAGAFFVSTVGPDLFIKSAHYQLRDMTNLVVDERSGDAHPVQGLPPIQARPGMRVVLDLVVVPAAERERLKQQYGLAESQEELKTAIAKLQADDVAGALQEVDSILATNPEVGAVHYVRGEALRRSGELEEAEQAFRRAKELDPTQPGVMGSIGSVLLGRGDAARAAGDEDGAAALYREALEAIDEQLASTPDDIATLTNRAVVVERLGGDADNDEVTAALEAVVEVSPDNLAARLRLADAYARAGRGSDALALLEAAPTKDVELARALFNVAVAEYNAGRIPEAIAAAVRSTEIEPTLADPYRLLGRAYLGENRRAEAIDALKKFLEIAPADMDTSTERQIMDALEKGPPPS